MAEWDADVEGAATRRNSGFSREATAQDVARIAQRNATAGAMDGITGGLTQSIRSNLGADAVDYSSGFYRGGRIVGTLAGAAVTMLPTGGLGLSVRMYLFSDPAVAEAAAAGGCRTLAAFG